MTKTERNIVLAVFAVLALPMVFVNSSRWIEGSADTAFLSIITDNVATTGRADNPIFPSILTFLDRIATLPAEDAANVDLTAPSPEYNHLRFHAYFVLYLIAPLAWLFPVEVLWPALIVLAYLGLLLLNYIFLRRRNVSIQGSLAFCILLSFHPSWSQGIAGQIFVDRLFLAAGTLFLHVFTRDTPNRIHVVALAVLCASLIERTALMVGVFMIAHSVFYWRERAGFRRFSLVLGGIMLVYGMLIVKFFLTNNSYSGFLPANFANLMSRFADPVFASNTGTFLTVNLGMLGIVALFSIRAFCLALAMLIPNVLGTIGGAEKVGWSTHYHTTYLPFLAWAAATGYVVLHRKVPALGWQSAIQAAALLVAVGLSGTKLRQNALCSTFADFSQLADRQYREARYAHFEQLRTTIPVGSSVSGPEGVYPALYKGRVLNLYPLGMEQADYAIPNVVSYLGEENRIALAQILRTRMKAAGYDMNHPVTCGSFEVFHRSHAAKSKQ